MKVSSPCGRKWAVPQDCPGRLGAGRAPMTKAGARLPCAGSQGERLRRPAVIAALRRPRRPSMAGRPGRNEPESQDFKRAPVIFISRIETLSCAWVAHATWRLLPMRAAVCVRPGKGKQKQVVAVPACDVIGVPPPGHLAKIWRHVAGARPASENLSRYIPLRFEIRAHRRLAKGVDGGGRAVGKSGDSYAEGWRPGPRAGPVRREIGPCILRAAARGAGVRDADDDLVRNPAPDSGATAVAPCTSGSDSTRGGAGASAPIPRDPT